MVRRIVTIIISLVAAAAVYSCTSANSISPEGYANQGSKTASESAALSSYEQKEKLEDTGKELLDLLDEENWEDTADFFKELAEHFAELDEDGMEAFEEWSEEMEDEIMDKKARGGKMTIKRTAAFSRIKKGTFKEDDGYFEFTPGGSSIKVITYVNGKTVTITVTNGAESKAYEVYSEHWESSSDWDKKYYEGEEYEEWDETDYVKIPSWINIEVKEGMTVRANWKANFKFTDSDGDGKIDLEKDKAEIDTEIKAAGYTAAAAEKYYVQKGESFASASASFYKGSKLLVAAAAEGSAEVEGDMEDGYKVTDPKKVKGAIDILGKVQAKGTIDYEEALYLEEKLDPYDSEDKYARNLARLEECIDVAIYYDKKGGKQARIGLEPFYNERNGKWGYDTVVRFADGSSYTMEEFFNEDNFRSLLRALESWQKDLEYYYGEFK